MTLIPEQVWKLREAFRAQGHDLRLVGGTVRDHLVGVTPKDVDMHTDATPEQCVEIYLAQGVRWEPTGIDHGTVTVVFDHVGYEITSLREDVATDGRRATVSYTRDWVTDLERRDFTMNAMSMSFEGDILDPFGGQADLRAGVVRFVGDAERRIQEDYLRILRWFRFRGRFGMVMDAQAKAAVQAHASGLKGISRERVWMEISKILSGDHAVDLMEEIAQLEVAGHIGIPEKFKGGFHIYGDEWSHAVSTHTRNPVTILVAVCFKYAPVLLKTWKASSAEIKLAEFLRNKEGLDPLRLMSVEGVSREWALELCVINNAHKSDVGFLKAVLEEIEVPVFPVSGDDLIQLGMKPGVTIGQMLNNLKERWANENYLITKQALLEVAKPHVK